MNTTTQKRIILWSLSRTLSTAMCRVMMNSGYSAQVLFEPFAEAYHLGPERISDYYEVTDPDPSFTFSNALKSLLKPYADKELVFAKLISGQQDPDYLSPEWIPDSYMHTFITRHPRKVALSLTKIMTAESLARMNIGYGAQVRVLRQLQQMGRRVVVLDAEDVLDNPEGMLRAYCREVGLEFCDSMVNWKPISEEEAESIFSVSRWGPEWFSKILTTSRIEQRRGGSNRVEDTDDTMHPKKREAVEKCVEENMKHYEVLRALRLKL